MLIYFKNMKVIVEQIVVHSKDLTGILKPMFQATTLGIEPHTCAFKVIYLITRLFEHIKV